MTYAGPTFLLVGLPLAIMALAVLAYLTFHRITERADGMARSRPGEEERS